MLKNITFSADPELIERARKTAEANHSTLNNEFRRWLSQYARRSISEKELDEILDKVRYVEVGRKITREEMNER